MGWIDLLKVGLNKKGDFLFIFIFLSFLIPNGLAEKREVRPKTLVFEMRLFRVQTARLVL